MIIGNLSFPVAHLSHDSMILYHI